MKHLSRIFLVSLAAILIFGLSSYPTLADELDVLRPEEQGGRILSDYLRARANVCFQKWEKDYEAVKTADDIANYQKRGLAAFARGVGDLPERTPLNPQVVGKIDREGYTIEKIRFESRPNLIVTALFYLPDGDGPFPGVLVPCGHSDKGKAYEAYQRLPILLAKNGMAALCYDPIEQGERMSLLQEGTTKPIVWGVRAHNLVGGASSLLGTGTAAYRIWDGVRAIDYLQSREEVDANRIGCSGNSGGGTMTSLLMTHDERIRCAAPSCFITSYPRLLETLLPQDAEQNLFGQIAEGVAHADYLILRAPRPALICSATSDFFDIRGTWESYRAAKRMFGRMGFAERVDLIEHDAGHGLAQPIREGISRWMSRWLKGEDRVIIEDPSWPILSDVEARCTPDGQALKLDGARSPFDINSETARKLAELREQKFASRTAEEFRRQIREVTKIRTIDQLSKIKVDQRGKQKFGDHWVERIVLQGEGDIPIPLLLFTPKENANGEENPPRKIRLYVSEQGKRSLAAKDSPLVGWLDAGDAVVAIDVRGCGELTGTVTTGGYAVTSKMWCEYELAYMLGESILAQRAEDVLRTAIFMRDYFGDRLIEVTAIGRVGPAVLHAVALESKWFGPLGLEKSMKSWLEIVDNRQPADQFDNCVFGVLKVYDLPDLLSLVKLAEPTK